jgi:hypothetical protein
MAAFSTSGESLVYAAVSLVRRTSSALEDSTVNEEEIDTSSSNASTEGSRFK